MRGQRLMLRLRAAPGSGRRPILAGLGAVVSVLAAGTGTVAPWQSPLAAVTAHADSRFDDALLSLFNQDRANRGLPPLQSSAPLGALAETSTFTGCGYTIAGRAEDLVNRNYFSHAILNCGTQTVFDILHADGFVYSSAAENLGYAYGVSDPVAAAQWINNQFMQSPEHSGHILDPSYTTVGIGSWWTSQGQTWSGAGGGAQSNVVVAAAEFLDAPAAPAPTAGPSQAPPPPPPPPPAAATTGHAATVLHFHLPASRPAPTAAAQPDAAPPTAVTEPDLDDAAPPRSHLPAVGDPLGSSRVFATVGEITRATSPSGDVAVAAGLATGLAALRRRFSRMRRRMSTTR